MYDLTNIQNYSLADKSYAQNTIISQPDVRGKEDLIPIAWAAVLTVRTNGTDGSLTMNDVGHLVTTGAILDLYWLDPTTGAPMSCRAAVAGTVAGLIVPFTGALGTVLPAAATVVQVGIVKVYTISGSIIGNDASAILGGVDPGPAATIVLLDVVPSENLVMNIPANGCYAWLGVGVNPLAGKVPITCHFSHSDVSTPRNVRLGVQMTV